MLVEKPIAFESLDFLPGFPTLSKFACNPFSTNFRAGACANPPVAVGRERTPLNGWPAVTAAIRAAGGVVPSYTGISGLAMGEKSARHHRDEHLMLRGLGAHDTGRHHYEGNWPSASTLRNDHPRYQAPHLSGCGCGGSCSSCSGSGLGFTLDPASIMSWVTANWMPLAVGGALVWFLKRR